MSTIKYITAGESHGKGLTGIFDGLPADIDIDVDYINSELKRRQQGYGRGGRMKIESDTVEFTAGVRFGKTTGNPLSIFIQNKDWVNWEKRMSVKALDGDYPDEITIPRPGHADLAGYLKFGHSDIRNVIERASARETAAKVAFGAIAKLFLHKFDIEIASHVTAIHEVQSKAVIDTNELANENLRADASPVRSLDNIAEKRMIAAIDYAKENGDTVGGQIEVVTSGIPVGLGSFTQWDKKLDGLIAQAIMAIPAMKAVSIGLGVETGNKYGSEVHDPFRNDSDGNIKRPTNHAGGIEGGISNGEPIVVHATMKPISSLIQPLDSVDLKDRTEVKSRFERSDTCAVPAAAVVTESVLALVLMETFLDKFGGDNISDIEAAYRIRRTI